MKVLKETREARQVSQRQLAKLSGMSYKAIQLIESSRHNVRLFSLDRVVRALGYPLHFIESTIEGALHVPPESVWVASSQSEINGEDSYKLWLFNFVDAFRKHPRRELIDRAPECHFPRILALLASTVETLCDEKAVEYPGWASSIECLEEPWFVSGVENLKPMSVVESPIHFRKRNVFVLDNFLQRR